MIDPEYNLFEDLMDEDTYAVLLSYIIWDSKFRSGNQKISLIHDNWAYAIDGAVFDKIMVDFPDIAQQRPYDAVTAESLQFSFYKISLTMLPRNFVLKSTQRERFTYDYYPYANRPESFLIWFAMTDEEYQRRERDEIEKKRIDENEESSSEEESSSDEESDPVVEINLDQAQAQEDQVHHNRNSPKGPQTEV